MRGVDPACTPRNHRVKEAIAAAIRNFAPFGKLGDVLSHPYEERLDVAANAQPPPSTWEPARLFAERDRDGAASDQRSLLLDAFTSLTNRIDVFSDASLLPGNWKITDPNARSVLTMA